MRKGLRVTCLLLAFSALSCGTQGSATSEPLTGTVTSDAEGLMEGVLVSAKRLGSTITVTVVSNAQGRYAFPEGRLEPGDYRLSIRAAGYDLVDPGAVAVNGGESTAVDLELQPTQDLASQLMNAEWIMSVPGTSEEKGRLSGCVSCHSLTPALTTTYGPQEFAAVLQRMSGYSTGSGLLRPTLSYARRMNPIGTEPVDEESVTFARASYLASINLSEHPDGDRPYELRTLPRPTGRATQVIITEYDLPRPEFQPHDASVDSDGMVWFADFGDNVTARLDPRTGEIEEWRWPEIRPGHPRGTLDVALDSEGNPWQGLLRQGGILKFDKRTEQFSMFPVPPEHLTLRTNIGQISHSADGNMLWFKSSPDRKVHGLDISAGQITTTHTIPQDVFYYGMNVDSNDILYLYGIGSHTIGEMDLKTGAFVEYPTPTTPSRPRRGDSDARERPWFAFNSPPGGVGMLDQETKQISEWWFDVPYDELYDVTVDERTGEVYGGGMMTDYVYRLNPETGEYVKYLLPTLNVNIRRMDMDQTTTPVSVWIGENHRAKIAKLEPLD